MFLFDVMRVLKKNSNIGEGLGRNSKNISKILDRRLTIILWGVQMIQKR